jgi:hypothetical protein
MLDDDWLRLVEAPVILVFLTQVAYRASGKDCGESHVAPFLKHEESIRTAHKTLTKKWGNGIKKK